MKKNPLLNPDGSTCKVSSNNTLASGHEHFDLAGATSWGGVGPLVDYLREELPLQHILASTNPPEKASNADFPADFSAFWIVLLRLPGAGRLAHANYFGRDPWLANLLEVDDLPDRSTSWRDLHRFGEDTGRDWLRRTHQDVLRNLLKRDPAPHTILDADSTVETVHGAHMGGSAVGYNPRYKGRPSYHPLIFTEGKSNLVLGAWLRSGDAHDTEDYIKHLHETCTFLEECGRPVLYHRSDRGFAGEEVIAFCEEKRIHYTFKIKSTSLVWNQELDCEYTRITGKDEPVEVQVASMQVQLSTWTKPRRVVAIRVRDALLDVPQQHIFAEMGWRTEFIVTDMEDAPEGIWAFYNRRCAAENVIKELKDGVEIDAVGTGDFGANDADLVLKLLSYNVTLGFRGYLPKKMRNLGMRLLRLELLQIPGVVIRHARAVWVRLASWHPSKVFFNNIRRWRIVPDQPSLENGVCTSPS